MATILWMRMKNATIVNSVSQVSYYVKISPTMLKIITDVLHY